jgi:hypothetical protein
MPCSPPGGSRWDSFPQNEQAARNRLIPAVHMVLLDRDTIQVHVRNRRGQLIVSQIQAEGEGVSLAGALR